MQQSSHKENVIILSIPESFLNTNSKIEFENLDVIMFGDTALRFALLKKQGVSAEMFYLNDIEINRLFDAGFNMEGYKKEGKALKTFKNLKSKIFNKQYEGEVSLYDFFKRSLNQNTPSSERIYLSRQGQSPELINLKDYSVYFITDKRNASNIITERCKNILSDSQPLRIILHGHGADRNSKPQEVKIGGRKFKDIVPILINIITNSNSDKIEVELNSCYGAYFNPGLKGSPAEVLMETLEKEFPNKNITIRSSEDVLLEIVIKKGTTVNENIDVITTDLNPIFSDIQKSLFSLEEQQERYQDDYRVFRSKNKSCISHH
jgi:hypothetical protein